MSAEQYGAEMGHGEIADFLESAGLGTLAFGDERGGYAIPMSFGYDRDEDRCILQFGVDDESTKAHYVTESGRVSLSVHEWESVDEWKSVVIHGTLEHIPEEQTVDAAETFAANANIASLDVFQTPIEELGFEWYALNVEEKHGRQPADATEL